MAELVYVALGGNMGDSAALLRAALQEIGSSASVWNLRASRFYPTAPEGGGGQRFFLNAACSFLTDLSPCALFDRLEEIERLLGKRPKPKEAPRPIDLDLILFGEESLTSERLVIPHPRWMERLFVLLPMLELARYVPLPGRKKPFDLYTHIQTATGGLS